MKLNKLKSINIGGLDFNIKWNKKSSGGSFSWPKKEIEIGTELGDHYSFSILIHELKELIQVEQATRYERRDESNNHHFFYNHAQHSELCGRLGEYLIKFIK